MNVTITIRETLERTVQVEAESYDEALESVCRQYDAEEIVLTADDFASMEFIVEEPVADHCENCGCLTDEDLLFDTDEGYYCLACASQMIRCEYCDECHMPERMSLTTYNGTSYLCHRCIGDLRSALNVPFDIIF